MLFDRILLTFSVAIGTKSTNAIKRVQPGDLIQLFPMITSQSLGDRGRELNNITLERTIEYNTTQPQNSTAKESNATSEIESTLMIERRTKVYIACSRAHMFVSCLSYRNSLLAVTIVNNYAVTCPYKN